MLPKKVIKAVEKICCVYFWNGIFDSAKGAKVQQKLVYQPKTEGGLSLKNLRIWNKAHIARQLWLLFSASGSLWIAWVNNVLLKGKSVWLAKQHAISSWN